MAEIPVGELHTADRDAFFRDTSNQLVYRRVRDSIASGLLQQILDAIAGTANTTTIIINLSCTTADATYSQALPANTKSFSFKARGNSVIKLAYDSLFSSWTTIPLGSGYSDSNFYASQTLYFKCSKADEVIEIVAHT